MNKPSTRLGRCGPGWAMGIALTLGACGLAPSTQAQFAITEFMAANDVTLNDEDGDKSDWIEIQNQSTVSTSLGGWYLTDNASRLTKWQFPATNLPPSGYLVVFASEKNRRRPGAPLHTNFKLNAGGEYLALVAPDGTNVVSEFAPVFPPQVVDVSYGVVRHVASVTLLSAGAPVRVFVPPNENLGLAWTEVDFDDSSWSNGTTGVGYDRQTIGVNFLPLIGLNVEAMMYPSNPTLYARVPFTVANPADWSGLTLRVKFEDGFIAYLNGQEIARSNAPAGAAFNSVALAPRTDTAATNFVDFDVSAFRGFLIAGTNVLAFHALNNPTNSPDLLLVPQVDGLTPNGPPVARYFLVPTPGRANNVGVVSVGPVISAVQHTPAEPGDNDAIVVTARLRPAFAPVASATLSYRVMFGGESSVPFLDDGAHGDGAPGDGIYGASIAPGLSTPGQMVRWYITATDMTGTNVSRYPAFTATNESPAYLGTVIANPALTNPLPVFHWFVQNVPATDTFTGTRCSVYWNGEFYDNVLCRVRGATAPSFSKKPYKFDFNPGDHFRMIPGEPRVDELNLNSTHHDKAYMRAPLSFEIYRRTGSPACDAFNVRVQQNNTFFSVAVFTEQVDGTYLERRGFDPNGALYKMFNGLSSATSGVEKKTRRNENNADLQELVTGLSPGNPNRGAFIYDHFDVPALINYLAAGVLVQDMDRTFKNYYLHRDTDGTGLWTVHPWDKDLTFGLFGLQSDCLSGSDDSLPYDGCRGGRISHPLFGSQGRTYPNGVNNIFDTIYNTSATREMFLRRLRTLMDEWLQPPGAPASQRFFEQRMDELAALLQPDATLDFARWRGAFGLPHDLPTALGRLKAEYLDDRREHLYRTHSVDNVGNHPDVAGIPHAQHGSPALVFGAIEFNPASSNQAQEFVELLNPNPVAVDISGWRIEGGVDFTFAAGTVIPSNGRLYVSPDVVAFRSRATGPRAGQSLLVVGPYSGQLSARGETLTLRDAGGVTLATTNYPGIPSLAQQFLRITELMYHPSPLAGNTNAADEFEFVELKNVSTNTALDLRGLRFANGLEFAFAGSAVTNLAPGASVLVVKNLAAFTARYGGGLPVAGQYVGALENEGERLQLLDAVGEEVLDFSYDDDWYPVTDGLGFSLVVVDELAEPDAWGSATQWRVSGVLAGTPGTADPGRLAFAPVVVNEVLSRTDSPPPSDTIELFNPATTNADIGGWFISDDFNTPKKFRIPDGTIIGAGGFRTFTEADFNAGGLGFAFSSLGDEAWLFSGDAQTNLTGYVHGVRFGAAENAVSFGRHLNSIGEEHFVAQSAPTLQETNAGPHIGPIVISEIHYHPSDAVAAEAARFTALDLLLGAQDAAIADTADRLEFVELQNITSNAVPLFDPLNPTNTWRLRGDADFDFPTNATLAPGALLLLVNFDPVSDSNALAVFRGAYALGGEVPLFGPYSGSLDNGTARVELQKPDAPNGATVPYVVVETVRYRDAAPWPIAADGAGSSLQRLDVRAYGNDPSNWFAAGLTPGVTNALNVPPTVSLLSPTNGAVFGQPLDITLAADANDSDGVVTKVQFFAGATQIGEDTSAPFDFIWTNAPFGSHLLTARATDNRLATALSAPVSIQILARPPTAAVTSPTNGALLLANSASLIVAAAEDVDGFIARVEFYANQTKLGEATVAPYTLAWSNAVPGNYVLSVVAIDNGGFTAVSAPVNVWVVPGSASDLTLIATGAVWKYFDQGTDLGTAWRTREFNDVSWASGPAPLGYGDGDEATTNSFGPDPNNKFITTYYRRAFAVTNAAGFTALNLRVLRDDGAVVYLNGTEVFRTGMPTGPVVFDTLANVTAVGDDETINFYSSSMSPALLVDGTNVVAVEIHQQRPDSSDISFNLELTGSQTLLGPVITQHPATQTALVGSTVTFTVDARGTPPLTYQWRRNGTNLPGATDARLVVANAQVADGGTYWVVVANSSGSATSRGAALSVLVAGGYGANVLADAPLHYYRLEETSTAQPAADAGTPGGQPGTHMGGITLGHATAPLQLGRCIRLDGQPGTLVDLGLFHPGNAVTLEAWANLDSTDSQSYHIVAGRWDGSYELDFAPGDVANFSVRRDGNGFGQAVGATPSARDRWHHLVGVFSGGTVTIYVDGVKGSEQSIGGVLQNAGPSPDRVMIGATRSGTVNSFNWKGRIDEVAVYDYALPPHRILAHYHAALPAPVLTINAAGEITWPALPAGSILQRTDSLAEPVHWTLEERTPVERNGYFRLTVPLTGTNRFYRLQNP